MYQSTEIKFKFFLITLWGLTFLVSGLLSGCTKPVAKRTYDEIVEATPMNHDKIFSAADSSENLSSQDSRVLLQEMLATGEDPHAFMKGQILEQRKDMENREQEAILLSWNVPNGWHEKSVSGMRLASFASDQDPGIDVSIVSLGGMAGGVSANVNRWLKQINLPSLDEEALNQFLSKQKKFKTESGLSVTLVDLTMLQEREDNNTEPGILAAMVEIPERTVFLKMSGTVDEIDKNREAFAALCQSLQLKHP